MYEEGITERGRGKFQYIYQERITETGGGPGGAEGGRDAYMKQKFCY